MKLLTSNVYTKFSLAIRFPGTGSNNKVHLHYVSNGDL